MTSTLPDDLEIAPGMPGTQGYTVGYWMRLKLDPDTPNSADWNKAVEIFDARIRRRFLDPVDALIKFERERSHWTFGFAILAIDFLVIETLQGFREGKTDHKGKGVSECLITNFLMRWTAFTECLQGRDQNKCAKLIYRGYRCALHHSGATEGAFRVRANGERMFIFENEHEVTINRTRLHENLKREFEAYLVALRKPEKKDLRCNFKKKMDAICGL